VEGTRIKFVDAYVRKRHAVVLLAVFGMMVPLFLIAAIWGPPPTTSRTVVVACALAGLLIAFGVVRVIQRKQARELGLYIFPDALEVNTGRVQRLPFYYNIDGLPLLRLHACGRQWEITSGSQHRVLRLPKAAIPSLPQILIHYKLDVKLVESA
jgi:hypothetical protein